MITTLSKTPKHEPLLPTLQKLNDIIEDTFNYEYLNIFEDILLISQHVFLNTVSSNVMKYLEELYKHNEMRSTFAKETIKKYENVFHMKYVMQYTAISNAYKKYCGVCERNDNNFKYLNHYRRHCSFTDEIPYHNCNRELYGKGCSLIEIEHGVKEKKVIFVICTLCKKCFMSDKILLWCNNCNCEYYSSILGKNEKFDLLPATWVKYHCGNVVNETMKCIHCKAVFNLNLSTKKLECSNMKCSLQIEPNSIVWNCIFCKKEFCSEARVFNPLEVDLIKQSIKRAISLQINAFPHTLPCCPSANINTLKFYHKPTCKGQLYEGVYNNNRIVVCGKCNAMNFYNRFVWICPLCNFIFRLCGNENYVSIDPARRTSDTFYSNIEKRDLYMNSITPTSCKKNSSLSKLTSFELDMDAMMNLNKTALINNRFDFNKRIPLSTVSSGNKSTRAVFNVNHSNKREPHYSTLIDIMKKRNIDKKFLSGNNSVLRVKPLSRTESAIKIYIDNKLKHNKSKVAINSQNTSSNTLNNISMTPSITTFNNSNLKTTQGRNSNENNYMSIPPKIVKHPKKIAINLFESFNKAEEEENDSHPLSTKARMLVHSRTKYNSSFFDSPLVGNTNAISGRTSFRNVVTETNITNKNNKKENEINISKENSIRHIYQLNLKHMNSSNNSNTHSKALTGSTCSGYNNKTSIPNSKMILINKQQKNRFAYSGIDSDPEKEEIKQHIRQGIEHSIQNSNANQVEHKPKQETNPLLHNRTSLRSTHDKQFNNSHSNISNNKNILNSTYPEIPSMEQQSSNLLNEILSTSIIPSFNIEHFKFLNPIGEGSYGKIYCIQDNLSKSKYALKKIIAHDMTEIKRYQKEFELVYSYTHPNIMKIYNIQYKCLDFSTFSIYVLMELASCDWNADIKRKIDNKRPYKENELINILSSLVKALSFLQKKHIAHRDIKPQNILLYPNNVVKVADFGEAKEIKIIKQQNTLKGTEMYMSPILYNAVKFNKQNVEHNVYKSDVFSLGFCCLYAASLSFKIISELRDIKDMKEMRLKIGKYLNKRYSMKFVNALVKMVEYDEKQRVDFIEMEKYIKENF